MQTSLIRTQLLDRPLDAHELQNMAFALVDWFNQRYQRNAHVQITMTLWGFGQKQGETIAQQVWDAAHLQNLSFQSIALNGPDFLVVKSASIAPLSAHYDGATSTAAIDLAALGASAETCVRLLQTAPFENGWCEIAVDFQASTKESGRIILMGRVQNGVFHLNALWPDNGSSFQTDLYASAPWPQEAQFLQGVADYAGGNHELPEWARKHLFLNRDSAFNQKVAAWFLNPPRKGWKPFAERVFLLAVVICVCFAGQKIHYPLPSRPLAAFTIPLFFWFFVMAAWTLAYLVGNHAWMIWKARSGMRAGFEKFAAQTVRYLPVSFDDAPPNVQNDPAVIKFSRDVEDLGGEHFQDIRIEPSPSGQFIGRIFLFPLEATVFVLHFTSAGDAFRRFPAKPAYLLYTYFADGFRLVSLDSHGGYRPKFFPKIISRRFVDVSGPSEMLKKHLRAVRIAEEKGHVRLPLEPDNLIAQMEAGERETWAASRKYGHFHWEDASRMVFDLPRREYAEDA